MRGQIALGRGLRYVYEGISTSDARTPIVRSAKELLVRRFLA